MAMHKIVNGERVDLSPEEEVEMLADWERNRINQQEKLRLAEIKEKIRQSAIAKLQEMGLSFEEIESLMKG